MRRRSLQEAACNVVHNLPASSPSRARTHYQSEPELRQLQSYSSAKLLRPRGSLPILAVPQEATKGPSGGSSQLSPPQPNVDPTQSIDVLQIGTPGLQKLNDTISEAVADDLSASALRRQFIQQQGMLLHLRDKLLQVRSELDFEEQKLSDTRQFEHQSRQNFMQAANESMAHRVVNGTLNGLSDLHRCLTDDYFAVDAQAEQTRELQRSISNLEFRIMTTENAVAATTTELLPIIGVDATEINAARDAVTTSVASTSDLPSPLAKYYDSKGEVGIQQERLLELDDSYREAVEIRDFKADQDAQPPQVTDEEFRRDYEKRRQQILSDLAAAEKGAEMHASRCDEAGIQTQTRRRHSSTAMESFDQHISSSNMLITLPEPRTLSLLEVPYYMQPLVCSSSTGRLDRSDSSAANRWPKSRDRYGNVENWLDNISTHPFSPVRSFGNMDDTLTNIDLVVGPREGAKRAMPMRQRHRSDPGHKTASPENIQIRKTLSEPGLNAGDDRILSLTSSRLINFSLLTM